MTIPRVDKPMEKTGHPKQFGSACSACCSSSESHSSTISEGNDDAFDDLSWLSDVEFDEFDSSDEVLLCGLSGKEMNDIGKSALFSS